MIEELWRKVFSVKKKKTAEQQQAEFKNNPFRALKGLAPVVAPPVIKKKAAPPALMNIAGSDEDDASLFLRAAEGAKQFDDTPDAPLVPAARPASKTRATAEPEDSGLFLAAMQKIGTTFRDTFPEEELPEPAHRSSTSRMRQLKRGTIRISQELDLHGCLRDEALARLEQFVADACGRGQQAVLVITGKGINSPEGPVLLGAVADWLRQKGKGRVVEFSPAPRELGGSGAFVVFLKM